MVSLDNIDDDHDRKVIASSMLLGGLAHSSLMQPGEVWTFQSERARWRKELQMRFVNCLTKGQQRTCLRRSKQESERLREEARIKLEEAKQRRSVMRIVVASEVVQEIV